MSSISPTKTTLSELTLPFYKMATKINRNVNRVHNYMSSVYQTTPTLSELCIHLYINSQ